MGARESVRDVARNLERFVDAIIARTGPHGSSSSSPPRRSIPVINGLTLREHPCQALADLFTLRERFGRLDGLVLALRRRRQQRLPLARALGRGAGHGGPARPSGRLRAERRGSSTRAASSPRRRGGRLVFGTTRATRSAGAAVVYTDAWTSMGQEAEAEERRDAFARYQVDAAAARRRRPGRRRHALPAGPPRRGDHVRRHGRAAELILDQSENRLHVQKALLVEVLGAASKRPSRRSRHCRRTRPSTSATRTPSGAATSRRSAAASTRRSPPTARPPSIAPDRALPHAAIGGDPRQRMGRPADALAAYDAALGAAPRDEAALRGRAEALAQLGRRTEAADDARSPGRSPGGGPAACPTPATRPAGARARRVEGAGAASWSARRPPRAASAGDDGRGARSSRPSSSSSRRSRPSRSAERGRRRRSPPRPSTRPSPSRSPSPSPSRPIDGFAARGGGRGRRSTPATPRAARERLLAAAAAHRAAGRSMAALDACYLALAVAPADVDLHLAARRALPRARLAGTRRPTSCSCSAGSPSSTSDDRDPRPALRDRRRPSSPDEPRLTDALRLTAPRPTLGRSPGPAGSPMLHSGEDAAAFSDRSSTRFSRTRCSTSRSRRS